MREGYASGRRRASPPVASLFPPVLAVGACSSRLGAQPYVGPSSISLLPART